MYLCTFGEVKWAKIKKQILQKFLKQSGLCILLEKVGFCACFTYFERWMVMVIIDMIHGDSDDLKTNKAPRCSSVK